MNPTDGSDKAPECSCGSDCCSGAQGAGAQGSEGSHRSAGGPSRRLVSLIVFIVVVAAAIAVGLWSLTRAPKGGGKAGTPPAESAALAQSGTQSAASETPAAQGPSLTVAALAPGSDFAFVLLAGADRALTGKAEKVVKQASGTLVSRGIRAAAVTLAPGDAHFAEIASALSITNLPAVAMLGGTWGLSAATGDIAALSEDGLLKDYISATCASGCGLGGCPAGAGTAGCCPGQ